MYDLPFKNYCASVKNSHILCLGPCAHPFLFPPSAHLFYFIFPLHGKSADFRNQGTGRNHMNGLKIRLESCSKSSPVQLKDKRWQGGKQTTSTHNAKHVAVENVCLFFPFISIHDSFPVTPIWAASTAPSRTPVPSTGY